MRKIPTLFVRDWEHDRSRVTREPNPDCAWVFAGEGRPTRKLDGTCTRYDGRSWWARREVKPGKTPPPNFELAAVDDRTGKRTGWEPIEQSSYARWHAEALTRPAPCGWEPGTYELCGPKVNGNPEGMHEHLLLRHGAHDLADVPLDFDGLARWLLAHPYEGIVWHHREDQRMAKLKRKDIPADQTYAFEGGHGPEAFDPAALTRHAWSQQAAE